MYSADSVAAPPKPHNRLQQWDSHFWLSFLVSVTKAAAHLDKDLPWIQVMRNSGTAIFGCPHFAVSVMKPITHLNKDLPWIQVMRNSGTAIFGCPHFAISVMKAITYLDKDLPWIQVMRPAERKAVVEQHPTVCHVDPI